MAAFAGKHGASHTTLPSPGVAALPPDLSSWHLETPQLLFFHPKSTARIKSWGYAMNQGISARHRM